MADRKADPKERIEPEQDIPAPNQPKKEPEAAGRLPKKPTAKTLQPAILQLLGSINSVGGWWAGERIERRIWILQPEELEAEATAITDVILAYPWLYAYFLRALQNTAFVQLLLLQVVLFRPRIEYLRQYLAAQEAARREASEYGSVNGAGPDQRADLYTPAPTG